MIAEYRDRVHALPLRTRLMLAGAVVLLASVAAGGLYVRALVPEVPSREELADPAYQLSTVVFSSDGRELARFQRENRTWAPYGRIASNVIGALVATEDHRFFAHDGIDVLRLGSSVIQTVFGDRQGGSTLTMQLVRNLFPEVRAAPPHERKLKEIIGAFRLEQVYGKPEILELYLNMVPFGNHAFGIEAAAQTYFGKPAAQLSVPEGALLIGMLKGPSRYNPVRHPERALRRRNVVMDLMVRHGYLDRTVYERLRREPLGVNVRPDRPAAGAAPHFVEYVRAWADGWASRNGYDLYADGLRIYTTLDARLQAHAQAAVDEQMRLLQAIVGYEWSRPSGFFLSTHPEVYEWAQVGAGYRPFAYFWRARPELARAYVRESPHFAQAVRQGRNPPDAAAALLADRSFVDSLSAAVGRLEAGFVAIDPATGHVKAWVGGRDFALDQYDKVGLARRQPGSTFKPFVFAAALDHGYAPDQPVTAPPQGYRAGDFRRVAVHPHTEGLTLRDALAYSSNSATQHLVDVLTPARIAAYAARMGITSDLRAVSSIGLGTSEVTLLELVSAYGTLANRGDRLAPLVVTRIEDRNGRVLARFEPEARHAVSAYTAYAVVDMLRGSIDYGTSTEIRTRFGIQADVAGKTGTTQRSADGWFVLMHPTLVAGAWVGFNDPRITFRSDHWGQGGHNALYVVGDFFRRALADPTLLNPAVRFAAPPGLSAPPGIATLVADTTAGTPPAVGTRDADVERALRLHLSEPVGSLD